MPKRKSYSSKSYGGNWKKYILWYIVIAAVVYALFYFLVLKKPY